MPPGATGLAGLHWWALLKIPAVLIALAIPLVLGLVPPNRWYGYRTARSLNCPAEWSRLNRLAGLAVIAAALLSVAIKVAVLLFVLGLPHHPRINLIDAIALLFVVVLVAACAENRGQSSRLV